MGLISSMIGVPERALESEVAPNKRATIPQRSPFRETE